MGRTCRFLTLLMLAVMAQLVAANAVTVVVNGRTLQFDQPPVMSGGRVLVPLRGIFESLGADVVYNAADRSIHATRGNTTVLLTLASTQAVVDGHPVTMDVPAQMMGGRTLVPLRFISEALGGDVRWNAATSTVTISSSGAVASPAPRPAVQPQMPQIGGVVIDGSPDLRPGDILRVRMTGTPGGVARFEVEGVQDGIGMQERERGRYQGQLTISREMRARRAQVVVRLRAANGLEAMRAADQRVSIDAAVAAPRPSRPERLFVNVTSPRNGQRLDGDFILSGLTLPFARIQAQIAIDGHGKAQRRQRADGRADGSGRFLIALHVGALPHHGTLSLQVQALDSLGRSTPWQQFHFTTGP